MSLPVVQEIEEEGEVISITEKIVSSMMVDDDGNPLDEMGSYITTHFPDRPWPYGGYITSRIFHNYFLPPPKPSRWQRLKAWLEREF